MVNFFLVDFFQKASRKIERLIHPEDISKMQNWYSKWNKLFL